MIGNSAGKKLPSGFGMLQIESNHGPTMHIFTSITSNYIPKARVLARSVKTYVPDSVFHVVLCDTPPHGFDVSREDFDNVILLEELEIENRAAWIFQHNVVELCTAVKGLGFLKIFQQCDADKVIFLDPDIVLFSGIHVIDKMLDEYSIVVTPHQTEPETSRSAVLDNEVSSLKHGVFNLGFLAIRKSPEGMRFLEWWSSRLRDFCFDDRGQGLFTDQKWIDLAPAFFPDLGILREPQFNVSTWNISRRELTGSLAQGIYVNGQPLCFYHFSGTDSGALKVMMEVYGSRNPILEQLRSWYQVQCNAMGQKEIGGLVSRYESYANGERIRSSERLLYRYREELTEFFPDPYDCSNGGGYQAWFKSNAAELPQGSSGDDIVSIMRNELDAIHHSISWRVFRKLSTAYRRLGLKFGLNRLVRRLSHLS